MTQDVQKTETIYYVKAGWLVDWSAGLLKLLAAPFG